MKSKMINYKIINYSNKNNICFVIFSSNGIIYGSRTKSFVLENNYFEFMNVANNAKITNYASKIIFLRDMDMNFYINGINSTVNTVDKVINFIKKKTIGMKIVAIGYSSGGYMAILLSLFLKNVIRVYSFGGVLNIYTWKGSTNQTNYYENQKLIEASKDKEKEKYFNIIPYLQKYNHPPLFLFYGSKSVSDLLIVDELENEKIQEKNNIHCIMIDTDIHGGSLSYFDYVYLFTKNMEKITRLSKSGPYKHTLLSIKIQGLLPYFLNKLRLFIWKHSK